jgi:DNA-binding transcriptional regulator YdaS (Cro superfamily)
METIASLILLIEKAGAIAGTEYKLAKALGVPQQVLSDWKAGRRTCVPADRARLAAMAQEDAVQELVRATIQSTEGTLRGEQLATVLGKWLRATGEAKGSVWLSLTSLIYGTASNVANLDVLRCILC